MKIGPDAMGGDYASQNTVLGAIETFFKLQPDTKIHLLGDETKITEICRNNGFDPGNSVIIHCSQFIYMDGHPVKTYRKIPDIGVSAPLVIEPEHLAPPQFQI